jgi:hypothetical protein
MKKMNVISGKTTKMLLGLAPLAILLVAVGASSRGQGQTSPRGIVTPLASANLVSDGEPACLKVARENGDPDNLWSSGATCSPGWTAWRKRALAPAGLP